MQMPSLCPPNCNQKALPKMQNQMTPSLKPSHSTPTPTPLSPGGCGPSLPSAGRALTGHISAAALCAARTCPASLGLGPAPPGGLGAAGERGTPKVRGSPARLTRCLSTAPATVTAHKGLGRKEGGNKQARQGAGVNLLKERKGGRGASFIQPFHSGSSRCQFFLRKIPYSRQWLWPGPQVFLKGH